MKRPFISFLGAWLGFAMFLAPAGCAEDVGAIFLFKAVWYEQNNAGDPELIPSADEPYDITATVYLTDQTLSDPDWDLWISGMTVRTPSSQTHAMTTDYEEGGFDYYDGAVSQQALNSKYGLGSYRFTLSSYITGDTRYDVPLAADNYPPAPRCTNFDAAQRVDPTKDFTLRWAPFTGEGEREIWIHVTDSQTGEFAFYAGPIDGAETAIDIPAGMLAPGATYWAWISFTRYTHLSPQTLPETYSGFDAYNSFPLKATSGGSAPDPAAITAYRVLENGDLELTAACTADRLLTVQGAGAIDAPWSDLQTTTPASSQIVLTVPKATLGDRIFLRLVQE